MDLRNEIFFNPSSGFFGSNDNYPKTRRVGVEIGTKTDLKKIFEVGFLNKLQLDTNYSFQDPRFVDGSNNDKLIPFAPQNQASYGFNFGFCKHYTLTLGGRYVGSRYAINDTSNITPREKPYYLMDSKLSFNHNNLEIFASWNNMFNKLYNSYTVKSSSSTSKDYYPAAGTNFLVGTKLKF
jgi:iron complex outermembrane receptor protein